MLHLPLRCLRSGSFLVPCLLRPMPDRTAACSDRRGGRSVVRCGSALLPEPKLLTLSGFQGLGVDCSVLPPASLHSSRSTRYAGRVASARTHPHHPPPAPVSPTNRGRAAPRTPSLTPPPHTHAPENPRTCCCSSTAALAAIMELLRADCAWAAAAAALPLPPSSGTLVRASRPLHVFLNGRKGGIHV